MKLAGGHRHELARTYHDFALGEFNDQFTVYSDKGFVGIRVPVPIEWFSHNAHSDLMIVDRTKRQVSIRLIYQSAERQRVMKIRI